MIQTGGPKRQKAGHACFSARLIRDGVTASTSVVGARKESRHGLRERQGSAVHNFQIARLGDIGMTRAFVAVFSLS
jgi:hypothetical protein